MQAVQLRFIYFTCIQWMSLNVLGEPFLEVIMAVEKFGHYEMKQRP